MRHLYRTLVLASLAFTSSAWAQESAPPAPVSHVGERDPHPGPAANFTGTVTVEPVLDPTPPGRASLGLVTFEPGARSNWHTHPAGQSLYVTDGCGWTQREGGPVMRICEGDVAYVPAGISHWHGATDTTPVTHLAISELVDGTAVVWGKPVSDADYRLGSQAR